MKTTDLIKAAVETCKTLDPKFKPEVLTWGSARTFRLELSMLPETELDELAAEYGLKASKKVEFLIDIDSCPTVAPGLYFSLGGLEIWLRSPLRKATIEETRAEFAKIEKKLTDCCKPDEEPPTDPVTS